MSEIEKPVTKSSTEKDAVEIKSVELEAQATTDEILDSAEEETSNGRRRPPRPELKTLSNQDFFKLDMLGRSSRDKLLRDVTLRSFTGRSLFKLTYDRMDSYLHRPKEFANLVIARDDNKAIQAQISARLRELELFVEKRHKKVSNLFNAATAIEVYEYEASGTIDGKVGFSCGEANKFLSILQKIDETCYMAGYLEKVGELDIYQESEVTSEMYRKTILISRLLMVFISRTVRGMRAKLQNQKVS